MDFSLTLAVKVHLPLKKKKRIQANLTFKIWNYRGREGEETENCTLNFEDFCPYIIAKQVTW